MAELLTANPESGIAVQGQDFSDDAPEVRFIKPKKPQLVPMAEALTPSDHHISEGRALPLIFYKLDRAGHRVPGTERRYFVPEEWIVGGEPTNQALKLVEEREGWELEPEPLRTSPYRFDWEPHIHAEIWWCGDEVCDCHRPEIILRTPNTTVGRPWFRLTTLWEGKFQSEPSSEEREELQEELEAECRKRGLLLGANPSDLTWEQVREIDAEQMRSAHARL